MEGICEFGQCNRFWMVKEPLAISSNGRIKLDDDDQNKNKKELIRCDINRFDHTILFSYYNIFPL